ncbi:hypothetical protein TSUD_330990 [Trifolium subterraneum]|nr:hypothetical protein TSUD_330990 [Trifolium subterraneum]
MGTSLEISLRVFNSAESNNLYSLQVSGLANTKTVTIQPAGKDQFVLLATTKARKRNKPSILTLKSIMKEFLQGSVQFTEASKLPSLVSRRRINKL